MKLSLGFSPCPNDTFIFDALVNQKIDLKGFEFVYVLEDVETLNQWALEDKLDITKLSYHSFLHCYQNYALLHSGSALGKGVGPLLISKQEAVGREQLADWLKDKKMAIPGFNTTANLLLSLAFPEAKHKTALVFNEIEQAVLSGEFDAGLIIHENRFTYAAKGLIKLIDLGDWWEQETGAAIPLGGIVMNRKFDAALCQVVDGLIRESVQYAWKQYPALPDFVKNNSQEMGEDVMRRHIELYVNDYTTDLGEVGRNAISTLFEKAKQAGLIEGNNSLSIFC